MKFHVLFGDDLDAISSRRAELLENAVFREDVDCVEDQGAGLLASVEVPSMFGDIRYVACENFDQIDASFLDRLIAAAPLSDAVVVARCGTLPAAVQKKLKTVAELQKFALPKGRDGVGRVAEIASQEGVTLSPNQRTMLVERLGGDLERVRSICWQLAMVGATKPNDRQVLTLIGSRDTDGVPWAVTEALKAGDLPGALRAASSLEAMPVLAYLSNLVASAGRALDAGVTSVADVEALLGQKNFQARSTFALANKLGEDGVRTAWRVLTQAEKRAKSAVGGQAALELCLCELAPLWR